VRKVWHNVAGTRAAELYASCELLGPSEVASMPARTTRSCRSFTAGAGGPPIAPQRVQRGEGVDHPVDFARRSEAWRDAWRG
jgi:hypothetical protein